MSDKSDHLIERAAALLGTANPPAGPDQAGVVHDRITPLRARPLAPPGPVPPPQAPPIPALPSASPAGPPAAREAAAPAARPTIPLDVLERAGLVVARTKRTRISEEYRIVIGRVLRTMHEGPGGKAPRNLLMVTSAKPGEGKSFTALNLAGSIAHNAAESVLLVDVDPKANPLTDRFGLGERPGFLDLVANPAMRPEDVVVQTGVPNLAFIPVGARLRNSATAPDDGASVQPVAPTIAMLARRFPKSLIVLDAPPCLSASDPHTIAGLVGQIVMVVEAERTQRDEVEAALDLLRACPTITMLLNKVRMTNSATFGAYDYYGANS